MDPIDITEDLKILKQGTKTALAIIQKLNVFKYQIDEFEERHEKLVNTGSSYNKWRALDRDMRTFIDANKYNKPKKAKGKKSKEKPEKEKPEKEIPKINIPSRGELGQINLQNSINDYLDRRIKRIERERQKGEEYEQNRKKGEEERKRFEEIKIRRQEEKEREQIPVMLNEAGDTLIRIKKLTRRRPVDKIKLINAPIIETWFNNVIIDPENPRELIEAERRSILEFTDYYQGVPIPETHQTRFIGAHDITSNNPQAIEPTREEISEVVLSEIGEDAVKEQIKDMEKSGLLKGLLSLYANKPGPGPTSGSIVFEFADKLREAEKKDIESLKDLGGSKDPERLNEIGGTAPIVLNNLFSYIGKLGRIVTDYIIPVGVGAGISSKLLKKSITNIRENTLITNPYYSAIKQTPPPLGEFGPQQGYIIPRRGPAVYLKPFANKEDMMNKQREEALRQRDIGIKKSIM